MGDEGGCYTRRRLASPSTETCRDDEPFGEEEKARIKNLALDGNDRDSDEDVAVETCEETSQRSQESDESERVNEEEDSSSYVDIWEKDLEMISNLREKEPPHSLKRRQHEIIGASVKQLKEDCRSREEVRMAQFLEETKARWIAVGMLREEDAHLLQSVDGPYHPNIEKTREEYFTKKKAEEERALKEKAQSYYEDEWVMAKEKELQVLQRKEDAATDPCRHQTCSRLRHGSCRGCLKGKVSVRGRTWSKEVCAVGVKTCCHRTWLVFTRPSSNDSKHLVPTAISERAGIGRRPRDVHYTIDSHFTAPFSST